jgi:hypothetical protein
VHALDPRFKTNHWFSFIRKRVIRLLNRRTCWARCLRFQCVSIFGARTCNKTFPVLFSEGAVERRFSRNQSKTRIPRVLGRFLPWRELCICLVRLPISSRDPKLAQDASHQKQSGVLPGKDPWRGRHYALNYFFVNSICSPSIRAASARFQQVLFSRQTQLFSNALPFFSLMRASIFRCYD